jgi:hypothetical protein
MRRFGQFLMWLGVGVGGVVAIAIAGHLGVAGVSWIVNVGLAKLGLIASGVLIAGGATSVRLANRDEQRKLRSESDPRDL